TNVAMWGPLSKKAALFAGLLTRCRHTAVLKSEYDAIVIGGGHNGLVAVSRLFNGGKKNKMIEQENRCVMDWQKIAHVANKNDFHFPKYIGFTAENTIHIFRNLKMAKHGLKVYLREPHAFTPLLEEGVGGRPPRSLLLGGDMAQNQREISKFSELDAKAYPVYQAHMDNLASAIEPLLDAMPVNIPGITKGSLKKRLSALKTLRPLLQTEGLKLGKNIPEFYELLTAPITKILDRWFESEPLKATLATDAVIGAMHSPRAPGSGYVLLHHVMGEVEGKKGAWGYVEGGMGGVSQAIASAARAHGAAIFTEQTVEQVLVGPDGSAKGVVLKDGTEIHSKVVLSNATPHVTFRELTPQDSLPSEFIKAISQIDYASPVTKINVALDSLPNFLAAPNTPDGRPGPHHQCSIHLNCESIEVLEQAYLQATKERPSTRPMLELCIPSVLDPTLAPPGCHVVSIFSQFTPYWLEGRAWRPEDRDQYADVVFDWIERYAPGFKNSVVGKEVLTPPDLEKIFGLTGGNIFHGAMSLDQLYLARPLPSFCDYRSPVRGLYLCGSGAHPGGGVMGSAGWNAALTVLADLRRG
uniref:Pyridine nucleotide-disulfide oxidoreductase domain-containing protein 2 n=1 Tax=Lepisosteus oculatus TaxID=7918 RepID=W5MRC5_LEPOC